MRKKNKTLMKRADLAFSTVHFFAKIVYLLTSCALCLLSIFSICSGTYLDDAFAAGAFPVLEKWLSIL